MHRIRVAILILSLTLCPLFLNAQDGELIMGVRTGHNASSGGFAAFSIESLNTFENNFQLSAGAQYNTTGKTAFESRPSYYKNYRWGRLTAETLLAYTHLTSVSSFAAGAGADVSGKWVGAKLGYYYRLYGHKGEYVKEPFNVYYELRVNFLPMLEKWDLQFVLTNNETFELERHYQPSFIMQCRHDFNDCFSMTMGAGCKPAGMFNLSADYYQSFLNLGVCYSW